MKSIHLLCLVLLVNSSILFSQERAFVLDYNLNELFSQVGAFSHPLQSKEVMDGYGDDFSQTMSYAIKNTSAGSQELDAYVWSSNKKDKAHWVKVRWQITLKKISDEQTQVVITIEEAINDQNHKTQGKKVQSTGKFEAELREWLEEYRVEMAVGDPVQADSTAVADVWYDAVNTDRQDEFTRSMDRKEAEITARENYKTLSFPAVKKLLNKEKLIDFGRTAASLRASFANHISAHQSQSVDQRTLLEIWEFESSLGVVYATGEAGLEYYEFTALATNVAIQDIPLGLILNRSQFAQCLQQFEGFMPQWYQLASSESERTLLYIEFQIHAKTYVKLQFEDDWLIQVILSNQALP